MAMAPTPPGPAAPPAGPAAAVCPSCHQPVTPGERFCGNCGAALISPAPAARAPPDIRESVDQDRGFLKKLQLMIPGFRAYRQGDDIRAADTMLRLQVADRLVKAMQKVDDLRSDMVQNGMINGLEALGGIRSLIQRLEGQIRHAEQGYTGLSPAIRISPSTLDRLYELDYTFLASADGIVSALGPLMTAEQARDNAGVTTALGTLRDALRTLESSFSDRVRAVEGILQ